ncbi:MAG: hypothetical protein SFY32_03140 [Bacteroidota bacterium]|nr:hypothetical protein [Bacteroidota bacterium]
MENNYKKYTFSYIWYKETGTTFIIAENAESAKETLKAKLLNRFGVTMNGGERKIELISEEPL